MLIKTYKTEHYQDYKLPSMFIACSRCSFKCDKEYGKRVCQNSALARSPDITIPVKEIVDQYNANPITKAMVLGGLEPFDTPTDVFGLIWSLRLSGCKDDVIIYTGYTEQEVQNLRYQIGDESFSLLNLMQNLLCPFIIKYGRYIPNQQPHYDGVLGVNLASDNQYAVRYENAN